MKLKKDKTETKVSCELDHWIIGTKRAEIGSLDISQIKNTSQMAQPNQSAVSAINAAKEPDGGYKLSLFPSKKALKYQCSICTQVCCDAVESSCYECDEDENNDDDRYYCESCLQTYLNEHNFTCPINTDHKNVSLKTCEYIRNKVNNLITYCPYGKPNTNNTSEEGAHVIITKGYNDEKSNINNKQFCDWKGKLNILSNHLENECKLYEKPSHCTYNEYGCTFIGMSKDLKQHNNNCMSQHMDLICNIVNENKKQNNKLMSENKKLWVAINEIKENYNQLQVENKKLLNAVHELNPTWDVKEEYFTSVEDDGVVEGETVKVTVNAQRLDTMWAEAELGINDDKGMYLNAIGKIMEIDDDDTVQVRWANLDTCWMPIKACVNSNGAEPTLPSGMIDSFSHLG
eukprot:538128_1